MSASSPAIPLRRRISWRLSPRSAAIAAGGAFLLLALWAVSLGYPLRVTSDMPTYLALLRGLASHPFSPQSPFLTLPGIASPHATPYTVALALLWRGIAPPGGAYDPVAVGRFLGFVGIGVSIATLAMVALYARTLAGRRQAVLTVAVLLVLFGPAHVIWANDLTFNGFLYAGFYPQNVALALQLGALLALRGRSRRSLALATGLAAATMVVHPLTGVVLAGLAAADGCWRSATGRDGAYRSSFALTVGFLVGLAWPDYHLNQAMAESGIPGAGVIAACALAPRIAAIAAHLPRSATLLRAVAATGRVLMSRRAFQWLAIAGLVIVWDLALWQVMLVLHPPSDPLIHSNRLALYWGEDRWRWFLMFAAGATGICGLVRLAVRGEPLPLVWFAGCFGIALLGAVGLPVPVWWRFLLLAQVPLAIGTAVVLVEMRVKRAQWALRATLAFALVFKLVTLLALPADVTYFGSPLQPAYSLGRIIPASPPGIVASDPFTSYYIPGDTGRGVLTMTKAHVGSQAELDAATHGYALLHAFYVAGDINWWPTAQALWRAGVRFFLVEKRTSLAAGDLEQFSTGPTPLVRTAADSRLLGRLFWRLGRVGTLLHSDQEYALYQLDGARLFPVAATAAAGAGRRSGDARGRP